MAFGQRLTRQMSKGEPSAATTGERKSGDLAARGARDRRRSRERRSIEGYRACVRRIGSLRVVENDAQGVSATCMEATDAMAHGDAIGTARALHWSVVHGKDDGLTLLEGDDLYP